MSVRPVARRLAALTIRALAAALAWWVLVEGDASAFAFGAPVVVIATATRSAVSEADLPRIHPWGLLRFLMVFLSGVVRGGFDVAWRALSPRRPLSPDWGMYDIRLSGVGARRLLTMVISAMPGTTSVDVEGARLRIHVLATTGDELQSQIAALEESVARVFGEVVGKTG